MLDKHVLKYKGLQTYMLCEMKDIHIDSKKVF